VSPSAVENVDTGSCIRYARNAVSAVGVLSVILFVHRPQWYSSRRDEWTRAA
jgi:hypothetical protein